MNLLSLFISYCHNRHLVIKKFKSANRTVVRRSYYDVRSLFVRLYDIFVEAKKATGVLSLMLLNSLTLQLKDAANLGLTIMTRHWFCEVHGHIERLSPRCNGYQTAW